MQHHLFIGHDGISQGRGPVPRHALDPCRHGRAPGWSFDHDDLHAALFHGRIGQSDHDPGIVRDDGDHAPFRSDALLGPGPGQPRHARQPGARAVPAHPGPAAVRPVRPEFVQGDLLDGGALQRRAEIRDPGPLARRSDRVLRNDGRRRRHDPACAAASGQAAHRGAHRARQ